MHFRGIPTWSGVSLNDPKFLAQIGLCQEFINNILV